MHGTIIHELAPAAAAFHPVPVPLPRGGSGAAGARRAGGYDVPATGGRRAGA